MYSHNLRELFVKALAEDMPAGPARTAGSGGTSPEDPGFRYITDLTDLNGQMAYCQMAMDDIGEMLREALKCLPQQCTRKEQNHG